MEGGDGITLEEDATALISVDEVYFGGGDNAVGVGCCGGIVIMRG